MENIDKSLHWIYSQIVFFQWKRGIHCIHTWQHIAKDDNYTPLFINQLERPTKNIYINLSYVKKIFWELLTIIILQIFCYKISTIGFHMKFYNLLVIAFVWKNTFYFIEMLMSNLLSLVFVKTFIFFKNCSAFTSALSYTLKI